MSDKYSESLAHHAAEFIARESNRVSLITVTNCDLAQDNSNATVYVSVLPETEEENALNFLKRNGTEFRDYLKKHARMNRIPFVEFKIDRGEKIRRELESLV